MEDYLILILGFVLTFIKDIFRLERDRKKSAKKALTIPGRIVATVGVVIFVVGLLKISNSNKEKEFESQRIINKNREDSIRYNETMMRDCLLMEKQLLLNDQTRLLLTSSEALNREFRSKIELQNKLIELQEKEIVRSRYKITDEFFLDFEFWFNFQELQNVILEKVRENPEDSLKYVFYSNLYEDMNMVEFEFQRKLSSVLMDFFDETLVTIEFKHKVKPKSFMLSKRFNVSDNESENFNEDDFGMPYRRYNASIAFVKEMNIFKLSVKNLPVKISLQDPFFVTLFELEHSDVKVSVNNQFVDNNLALITRDEMFSEGMFCKRENVLCIPYVMVSLHRTSSISLVDLEGKDFRKMVPRSTNFLFNQSLNK